MKDNQKNKSRLCVAQTAFLVYLSLTNINKIHTLTKQKMNMGAL
jgi:hypothetical protein